MKNLRTIIVAVIAVCLVIGYYFYISNRESKGEQPMTEAEKLISKNLETSYPKTPREVMKFYTQIQKFLYNENYTEEEFEKIVLQIRKLLDEDLLAKNEERQYHLLLKSEIETFKKDKKSMVRISISESKEIIYKEVEGRECAYVDASYFMKTKKETQRSNQAYVLRKSEEGKWKIVAFKQEDSF
ncbi:hypothetical protein LQZ18_03445 [Lachnospiraceae bacterium ZAX-1]